MAVFECLTCGKLIRQSDLLPPMKECLFCGGFGLKDVTIGEGLPVDGGGMRSNSGKVPISLCPNSTIYAISKVMEFGSHKYEPNNWRRGMKWSVPYDCAMRHLTTWFDGDTLDSESKLNHLYHVAANIAMLIEYEKTFADGDDRPIKFNPRKKEEM
jgi:hypothetical protein